MNRRSLLGLGGAAAVSVATAVQGHRPRPGRDWLHTWVSMPQLTEPYLGPPESYRAN